MSGDATPAQIGGFLVALRLKGETADEIAGCAEAMRAHVLAGAAEARRPRRHGGHRRRRRRRRSTSRPPRRSSRRRPAPASRSTATARSRRRPARRDVLEALGFELELSPERIAQSIDELGFGFMFAPTHHPSMRHAAPVRRELAARTVFNVLGPLTNPAGARAQVVGVYSPLLVPVIADVLASLGARRAFVVHGAGGIDELSPAGPEPRPRGRRRRGARARDRPARPRRPALRPGRAARRHARTRTPRASARCSRARAAAAATRSSSTPRARSPPAATPRTSARASSSRARRSTRAPPRSGSSSSSPSPRRPCPHEPCPAAAVATEVQQTRPQGAGKPCSEQRRFRTCPAAATVTEVSSVRFADALAAPGFGAIAEFKRRSPSAGDLRPGGDVAAVARAYEAPARGRCPCSSTSASPARGTTCAPRARRPSLPLLAKGFFADADDLRTAATAGADAVAAPAPRPRRRRLRDAHARGRRRSGSTRSSRRTTPTSSTARSRSGRR